SYPRSTLFPYTTLFRSWDAPSNAVAGAACYDNGPWSVAEPRDCLPAAKEKLTAYILALDGTWHRPFTTYELAALQNLFEPGESRSEEHTSELQSLRHLV